MITFSQAWLANQRTDGPRTRLLELLRAKAISAKLFNLNLKFLLWKTVEPELQSEDTAFSYKFLFK